MNFKLLVIIVTYNGKKWVDSCFGSIYNSTIPADVYVIDNGSTDGTQEYIKQNYSSVIFHQSNSNLGFGKANNFGLQYAIDNKYDYVYLLNQDAWVFPETFETMINTHLRHNEFGILSPIQLQANLKHFDKNFLYICTLKGRKCNIIEDLYFSNNEITEITCTMAAHWLISRECLLKVGGFSPIFPHYCEDDNYGDRAIWKGFKHGIVLKAKAVHDREFRTPTKKLILYSIYVKNICRISNLHNKIKHPWLASFKVSLWTCFNQKSFIPIMDYIKLLRLSNDIIKCRELSKEDCAFLKLHS